MYVAAAVEARRRAPQLITLYVSCGDQAAIEQMRAAARKHDFDLIDKWGLLQAANRTAWKAISVAMEANSTMLEASSRASEADRAAAAAAVGNDTTLLRRVNSLNFDQLAVVDYAIMVAADVFFGIKKSTFSTVIAYDRGVRSGHANFFEECVFEGSRIDVNQNRRYSASPAMKGNNDTMLIVVNGFEYMDWYL